MSTIPPVPPLPPTSPSADDPAERGAVTPDTPDSPATTVPAPSGPDAHGIGAPETDAPDFDEPGFDEPGFDEPGLDAADTVAAPGADDVAEVEHVSRDLKRSAPDKVALPELSDALLDAVAAGTHHDPHGVLGSHPVAADGVSDALTVIRTRRPLASRVAAVLDSGARIELTHVRSGIWQGAHVAGLQPYRIEASYEGGPDWLADDAYAFAPTIGELDLHLIGEGRHERLWDVLGAHRRTLGTAERAVHGTSFAVWAPHASAVRVVGTFNDWHGEGHALRSMGGTGVWEIFVPDVEPGAMYKFQLRGRDGEWVAKADPLARHAETEGLTASIVAESSYEWDDAAWMERRAATNPHDGAMSVYELHAGSWRLGLGYRELADHLIEYVTELGFTHVEFMPLAEHPFGGSWGYQVTGYYAPTSRFGTPDDLRYLIDRLHQAGIGVLVDWVPGHFATDAWALAKFDGEALYEHPDPRRGEHKDWGTLIFDFGNPQVRNFLVANALYWLEEFHVDGLRVDAVASMLYLDYSREEGQWLPNIHGGNENLEAISLLQEANATAYRRNPGVVMIAEESTNWGGVTAPTSGGGLGFGFKWNMGWMHDSLQYIANDPMYRSFHHGEITFSFLYAYSENFLLPISHDEVVHGKGSLLGKMPGDHWQKLANLRAYLTFMWAHPGKQLLFMGQEFGQLSEWSEARDLDWWILDQPAHRGLHSLVTQLNRVYRENPALWALDNDSAGFEWLDGGDSTHNIVSFLRRDANGDEIAVFMNFSGSTVGPYRAGFPQSGVWEEILNSDAADFGGSGVGNLGSVTARDEPWAGRPASADITLPPLAGLWLKRRR